MFVNVIRRGLAGAITGIAGGLVLGLLIWALQTFVELGMMVDYRYEGPPASVFSILGMGWGAVIGSIFGGIVGFKEK